MTTSALLLAGGGNGDARPTAALTAVDRTTIAPTPEARTIEYQKIVRPSDCSESAWQIVKLAKHSVADLIVMTGAEFRAPIAR